MAAYIALILLPSLFALSGSKRISMGAWVGTFLIYLWFVGLRYEVGPDWWQYIQLHQLAGQWSFFEVAFSTEALSYTLFWFSDRTGLDVYFTNLVAAFIVLTGVYSFARKTCNAWIALLAASPYFIIVMGMSGIRQAMAAGVVLFLLSKWEQYSSTKRGVFLFISAMFHTSALINSIFLITQIRVPFIYRLIFGGLFLMVMLYAITSLSIFAENIVKYEERYIEGEQEISSLGSLFHIAMIAIPALLGFTFRRHIAPYVNHPKLLTFGLYAALVVFALNFVSSTAASRLTVYLYFIPMIVYPAFSMVLGPRNRQIITMGIIMVHIAILISWFFFANNSHSYLPYQNAIFQ